MMSELAARVMANEVYRIRMNRLGGQSQLPESTIQAIRKAEGSTVEIAQRFGTSRQWAGRIRAGKVRLNPHS